MIQWGVVTHIWGNESGGGNNQDITKPTAPENWFPREFSVAIDVPDLSWKIKIREIHVIGHEVWVIAETQREAVIAGQMISRISDQLTLKAPDFPVKYFILGKTWHWSNQEPYTFLRSRGEIAEPLNRGIQIYPVVIKP